MPARFTEKRVADGVYRRTFASGKVRFKAVAPGSIGANGRRHQPTKTTFTTKQEAVAWRRVVAGDRERGIVLPTGSLTLEKYLDAWLDQPPSNIGPNTLTQYRWALDRLPPALARTPLRSLNPDVIRRAYAAVPEGARSYLHTALHRALNDAPLPRNPATGVRKPRRTTKERAFWTVDEWRAFGAALDAVRACAARGCRCAGSGTGRPRRCSHVHATLWRLLAETGMRRGEALGLDWQDVDFAARTISVRRQFTVEENRSVLKDLKTGRSNRTIDIDATVIAALAEWREVQRATCARRIGRDAYAIFTQGDGRRLAPTRALSDRFAAMVLKAGVRPLTIHGLRHTHATLLLRDGQAIHVVSRRLGHANEAITLQAYAHVLPDQSRAAAGVMAALLA